MPRKKTDVVQLSKIRMREELRSKLARVAEKKGTTLNAEIVDRLEQSFADEAKELRDSAILDLILATNDMRGAVLQTRAARLAKNPNWSGVKAGDGMLELFPDDIKPQPGDDK
jgi:hypothetical protein